MYHHKLPLAGRVVYSAMMAQAKVNDFFTSKKRHGDSHASKRRKIELPFSHTDTSRSLRSRSRSDEGKKSPATNPLVASDSETETERDGVTAPTTMMPPSSSSGPHPKDISFPSEKTCDTVGTSNSMSLKKGRNARLKASSKRNGRGRGASSRSLSLKASTGQTKLTDMLGSGIKNLPQITSAFVSLTKSDEEKSVQPLLQNMDAGFGEDKMVSKETIVSEEVTSVWDDHDKTDGLCTPRKRIINSDIILSEGPKTRKHKVPVRKLINSGKKNSDSDSRPPEMENHESVKKKLDLLPANEPGPSKMKEDDVTENDKEVGVIMSSKNHLLALVAEVTASSEHVVSPLPLTPERPEEGSPSPEPITSELQNFSQKLKALSKMNGQALKNRLKQSGKIKEVKEKLTELGQAVRTKKEISSVDNEVLAQEDIDGKKKTEDVLPAHERFQHLIEPGVPKLPLPFSYKLLDGAFQAVDTVVSMMHNRSEMCTFSKLRAAVQNMTKKNFEEKTMGQIKTVVPDAYTFRQEKNIPTFGKKSSGYQLTVEANLEKDNKNIAGEGQTTKDGKPTFTASAILKRKQHFKNNLLDYVKQHHQTFLASLKHPLVVADDKLTRWHPLFQLDKVPEITSSTLPQPPEVKVYHSAKDVLEKQRGKLNPRVEEALAKVVAEKEAENQKTNTSSCPSPSLSSSSSNSSQNVSSLKGIPPALLAKIRAKEAQKMEQALTRNPAEDSKTKMMSRLPEIIRILRSYFLTEKKPALLIESVYKKLEDSYSTGVSRRDVEQYVNLLKELAPELVSVVEIKRGKYLKLDKNVDVQAVTSRIQNLVKSRK